MPDIAMCKRGECPLFDRCYRAQAQPSDRQSWIVPKLVGDQCEYFWPISRMKDGVKDEGI